MSWLALVFALELGLVPDSGWVMYESRFVVPNPVVYTQFEAEVRIGPEETYIFAGGSIRTTTQSSAGSWTWSPNSDQYGFRAGVRVGIVELGFRHLCTHPVFPYIGGQENIGDRPTVRFEGSYDELYLRIEGSTRW